MMVMVLSPTSHPKLTILAAAFATLQISICEANASDLTPIAGIWGLDKDLCQKPKSEYDERFHIQANGKNDGVESFCLASSVTASGSRLTFRNTCSSEGERVKSNVTVDIISPDRITWKDGKQPPINYVRCDVGRSEVSKGAGSAKAPPSYETGSFNLSSHSYSATITSLTNPDTPNAAMTGKVTRADAEEECERNSPGGEGLKPKAREACIKITLSKEAKKEYFSKANCYSKSISPHFGGVFTLKNVDANYNALILDSKGQKIGSSTASDAPTIQDQFARLCPAVIKKLNSR